MIWFLLGWFATGLWSAGTYYSYLRSIGAWDPRWNAAVRREDTRVAWVATILGPLIGLMTIATGYYKGWRWPGSKP